MKTKYMYFKGFYGYRNLGDDIFCVAADWITRSVWSKKRAIFIGDNLPNVSNNSKVFNIKNAYIRRIVEVFISIFANTIIYFGGSVFHSRSKRKLELKQIYGKYKIFNSKLGTIGTSIGPFKETLDYEYINNYLRKFKFISLRDYMSVQYAKEMQLENIGFSFDIAILIEDIYPELFQQKKELNTKSLRIGVSLCHYERYVNGDLEKEKKREDAVFDYLNLIIKENNNVEEVIFFEFNGNKGNGDTEIINDFDSKFNSKIRTRIIKYTRNTVDMCKEMKKCDLILGMRLHSGILSYGMGIPFILVEYHKKCTDFLDTINHNFRFHEDDMEINISHFNEIISKNEIPNIIDREYFKDLIYKELHRVEDVIDEKL